jgi:hypothetical protein
MGGAGQGKGPLNENFDAEGKGAGSHELDALA